MNKPVTVYVLHSNDYSDSENLGVFHNEQDCIKLEKQWTIEHNSRDLKAHPELKLQRVIDNFDGTTWFDIINTKDGSVYEDDEYCYDRVTLDSPKATTKRAKKYYIGEW